MKNRIKELRLKHNLTLEQLGQKVGLANNTLSRYENGKRKPNAETWQKIADYFNVSVPYLQGVINIKITADLKFESKGEAIDCIEKIMKTFNISKEDLEKSIESEASVDG
ncbi:helix-turn-helix domain-containing protein [Lactobacillus crispatus]|uniref:helix-turn-helix domain-containing protein n=1 Tax=Lactobacillus crispatus TaxID=47770 RepID=UPI00103A78A0|nr:helix-turn-helix transcriptional regulator [Lactobacillus crispatus]